MKMKTLKAKLVVLGSACVGKTSVVVRYARGTFSADYKMTMGASFFQQKPLTVGQYNVTLNIWDTCGEERFKAMTSLYYKKANVAILMYDITSQDSFFDLMYWVKELRDHVDTAMVLCLLGNKSDLGEMREISFNHAAKYAASINAIHFETSALENTGIQEAFSEIYKAIVQLYETHQSSSGILAQYDTAVLSPDWPLRLHDEPRNSQRSDSHGRVKSFFSRCCW